MRLATVNVRVRQTDAPTTVARLPAPEPHAGYPGAMDSPTPRAEFGPVSVYFGHKTGKYPDGNQVIVRGREATAAFDTPQVANRIGAALDAADLVILSHVHEDHMVGLQRLRHVPLHVHEADLAAAQSWEGLSRHYGYLARPAQGAAGVGVDHVAPQGRADGPRRIPQRTARVRDAHRRARGAPAGHSRRGAAHTARSGAPAAHVPGPARRPVGRLRRGAGDRTASG